MNQTLPDTFGKILRAAVLAGAGFSLAASGLAQQAAGNADDKVVKLEKFTVTGSNIPSTENAYEARTFPVQTIDRRLIEQSGLFNTTELLQKISLSNGGSVPFTNNATGFTPGGTSLSLRGFGPDYTLVLVNGRRMATYPIGSGGTSAFVDINSIPLQAIERVEILKDGASAVYGADAVAGVVNIIMRRDYNGAVASLTYGNTTDKDSSETTANLVYGVTGEKGSITVGFNFQNRQAIFNRDRSYSALPPFLSTNASPPNFQVSRAAVEQALGLAPGSAISINGAANTTTNVFFATTGRADPATLAPLPGNQNANNNGLLPASSYYFSTGRSSFFNYNEFSGSFPEATRSGVFVSWERKLAENVTAYGDAFFSQVHQIDELAPFATGNFVTPGVTTIVIPSRTPNPILTPAEIAAGGVRTAAAGAFNPFNPFNQDISGSSRIRLAEFGNRIYHNRNTAVAFTGGLRFENIADKFNLDTSVRHSTITNNLNARLISTSRFLRALNAADSIFNPASSNYIGTTQPYNPFGYFRNEIASNRIPVAFATHYQRDENQSSLWDAGATLNTGSLFAIPGGDVGFAIGGEIYREATQQSPDSALQSGDILGSSPSSPIQRQRKIGAVFSEVEIPLISEKNSKDFAHRLSLNFAGRYEKFFTSKRTAFVPKVGIRWEPRQDGTLVLRGSYGKGFKEPSLFQLYSPPVAALTPITDPVTGVFEPEQSITTAGNSRLEAEDSKSYNIGLVWSPKGALDGFTFSTDFWRIESTGQVATNSQDVIDRAAGVAPGGLLPGESVVRDFAGNLVQINGVFRNLGQTIADGADFSASYLWTTNDWGRFEAGVTATWLHSYRNASTSGAGLVELVDQPVPGSPSDDAYLKWKSQTYLGWAWKGLSSRLTGTYTHGFQDLDLDSNPRRVQATTVWDLQVSYKLFPSKSADDRNWWSDLKLTAGCNNLFDKDPPQAFGEGGNSNGYPGFIYTDVGRFVYVGIEKKL
ncbi:MAG: TonB-dependent receptor [Opitutae bacterium]|nr:TonB-dependent receptor [Opitutae bacterium]